MAVQIEAQWDSVEAADALYERAAQFVHSRGGKVKTINPFEARMGNFWMMRFLGFLTPEIDLPIRLQVFVDASPSPHRVRAVASDAMGFGLRTGVVAKFRKRLDAVMDELQSALRT